MVLVLNVLKYFRTLKTEGWPLPLLLAKVPSCSTLHLLLLVLHLPLLLPAYLLALLCLQNSPLRVSRLSSADISILYYVQAESSDRAPASRGTGEGWA